jgi:hypothetical protein
VEALYNFCKEEEPDWGDNSYVKRFVDKFETLWRAEVQRTNTVSALSHQEHHHAGLSGMNFVETLKNANIRTSLLGPCGMTARLAPFFDEPERLDANVLLNFYKVLVREPIHLRVENSSVQNQAARILGKRQKKEKNEAESKTKPPTVSDGSYNSMDYLRCYSNIMTEVFGSTPILFTQKLWKEMLRCQRKPTETRNLLSYLEVDMRTANSIVNATPDMNWTTFLVCICEVRQAMSKDSDAFLSLLEELEKRPELTEAIDDSIRSIVEKGAVSTQCYCVRLCARALELVRGDCQNVALSPQ